MSSELATRMQTTQINQYVDQFSKGLKVYLDYLKLPSDNILVEIKERAKVITNLDDIIDNLSPDHKQKAFYISKFIASCGAGLFDAALNYLWNETILNLREKIERFDLSYFFDSIVTDPKKRSEFKDDKDLKKLDDWVLISGCQKTGIISDIGYKHLDYIRDMRNFASAAHPNHTQLTGLQLVSWLETCINEVLAKEPTGPVLEVRRLLESIRKENLERSNIEPIMIHITNIPKDLLHSLLRAIFGMYTDENISVNIRNNINLLAKGIWDLADDSAKNDTGIKYAMFSANGEIKRKDLAKVFLDQVDGLSYLTDDIKIIEMRECLEELNTAHYGYNNFYTEEPYARKLSKYIPENGSIPNLIRPYYIKVLIICKLGNQYGVSRSSEQYYDSMINKFQYKEILEFIKLLEDNVVVITTDDNRFERFKNIASVLSTRTTNLSFVKALDIIIRSSFNDFKNKILLKDIKKILPML